jgi:DNA invertase Pin-like site-specific DNA recombinase
MAGDLGYNGGSYSNFKGHLMTQAIGYVRRSTDRQDESLDQQRAKLESYAKGQGWELVEVFTDDAISGSDMDRPGLAAMMQRARTDGGVGAVLTWDRNRLARPKDPVDGLMLERQLMSTGKRIVYVGTGTEPDRSFTSGLISYIENHQNGDYLRKLSRDVARGMISQVRRGLWPGGPVPFGYDRLIVDSHSAPRKVVRNQIDGSSVVLDAATGQELECLVEGLRFRKQPHEHVTLIPSEPARIEAVRRMFADYADGVPTRRIRDDLNDAGFRSVYGRLFTIPTINGMLENACYTGKLVYNKRTESKWHRVVSGSSVERIDEGWERRPASDWITVDDAWPAIIDADTFARVQARRRDSRERQRYTTGRATHAGYLLTGLMTCSVCGCQVSGHTRVSGRGLRTRYYVCSGHHRGGKHLCPKRYQVPAEPLEDRIVATITADLERLANHPDLAKFIGEELQRIDGVDADRRANLVRRLADLDRQQAKLRDHLLALDAKTAQAMGFYDQARQLTEEREAVEQEVAQVKASMPDVSSEAIIRAGTSEALDLLQRAIGGGTLEEKREVIAHYVQRIEADPTTERVRAYYYPVIVNWKIGVEVFDNTKALIQLDIVYRRE